MDRTSPRRSGFSHRLLVTDSQIPRRRQDHQLSSDPKRSNAINSLILSENSAVTLPESSPRPATGPDRVASLPKKSIFMDVTSFKTHTLSESSLSSYSTPSGSTTRHPSPSDPEITPKGKGTWTLQKSPSSSSLSSLTSLSSVENPKCQPFVVLQSTTPTYLASTSESVPLATVPPQLSRKGVRTRRTVQSALRPLGPRHLEYDYHVAHGRFKDAIYDGLCFIGYSFPSRKTNTDIEPVGLLESAQLMERLKRLPSVKCASHILNTADRALELALARGETWENTAVPDEYKFENLDLEGLHDARGLYDSILAMAKFSEDPQPPKKRGPGRPRTRGLLPQPSNDHQTINVGRSTDSDAKQVPSQSNVPLKRGPGRPRKHVPQPTAVETLATVKVEINDVINLNDSSLWGSSQSTTQTQAVTPRRGRGRPRKQPAPVPPVADGSPVKRRPGRPRKQPPIPPIKYRSPSRDSIDSVERLLIQPSTNVFDAVNNLHADVKPVRNVGADLPSPAKRRPGRPRKQPQVEVVIPDSNELTSAVKSVHHEPSNEGDDNLESNHSVAREATPATSGSTLMMVHHEPSNEGNDNLELSNFVASEATPAMPTSALMMVHHKPSNEGNDNVGLNKFEKEEEEEQPTPTVIDLTPKMGRPRKRLPLPPREDGFPAKRGPGRPRKRPLPAGISASPSKVTVKEEPCDVDMSILDGASLPSTSNVTGLSTDGGSASASKKRKLEAMDDDYLLLLPTRRSERVKRPRTTHYGGF